MFYTPHQLRVIEEQKELQTKIEALTKFIDSDNFTKVVTDEDERYLMIDQETHMKRYNRVLLKRIKNFKGE
jgi:hypothetical protein